MEQYTEKIIERAAAMRRELALFRSRYPLEAARPQELCAMTAAMLHGDADGEALAGERERVRQNSMRAGKLTADRQLLMSVLLCAAPVPRQALEQALKVYCDLGKQGFSASFLLPVSLWIALCADPADCTGIVGKGTRMRALFRERHAFSAQGEEECYLLLLALCGGTAEELMEWVEQYYDAARKRIFSPMSLLSVSCAMAAWGKLSSVEVFAPAEYFSFALNEWDCTSAAQWVAAAENELKKEPALAGFLNRKRRLTYAAAVSAGVYLHEHSDSMSEQKAALAIVLLRMLYQAEPGNAS